MIHKATTTDATMTPKTGYVEGFDKTKMITHLEKFIELVKKDKKQTSLAQKFTNHQEMMVEVGELKALVKKEDYTGIITKIDELILHYIDVNQPLAQLLLQLETKVLVFAAHKNIVIDPAVITAPTWAKGDSSVTTGA